MWVLKKQTTNKLDEPCNEDLGAAERPENKYGTVGLSKSLPANLLFCYEW